MSFIKYALWMPILILSFGVPSAHARQSGLVKRSQCMQGCPRRSVAVMLANTARPLCCGGERV
jgi:hypothetical protein